MRVSLFFSSNRIHFRLFFKHFWAHLLELRALSPSIKIHRKQISFFYSNDNFKGNSFRYSALRTKLFISESFVQMFSCGKLAKLSFSPSLEFELLRTEFKFADRHDDHRFFSVWHFFWRRSITSCFELSISVCDDDQRISVIRSS